MSEARTEESSAALPETHLLTEVALPFSMEDSFTILARSRRDVKILLVLCLCLLGPGLTAAARPIFPAEAELNGRLHPGMTREELVARVGEPGGPTREEGDARFLHYYAPINSLTNEHEGYIGFEVRLVDGKVQDWRSLRGRPSYEPAKFPGASRWTLAFWLLIIGGSVFYGTMRAVDRQHGEESAVQKAYQTREIPTSRLPMEFRFITHETTAREVIGKVGPYSVLRRHPVSDRFARASELSSDPQGKAALVSFDYDLPYHACLRLLPEPPFAEESLIRAVVYHPARADDEM